MLPRAFVEQAVETYDEGHNAAISQLQRKRIEKQWCANYGTWGRAAGIFQAVANPTKDKDTFPHTHGPFPPDFQFFLAVHPWVGVVVLLRRIGGASPEQQTKDSTNTVVALFIVMLL